MGRRARLNTKTTMKLIATRAVNTWATARFGLKLAVEAVFGALMANIYSPSLAYVGDIVLVEQSGP